MEYLTSEEYKLNPKTQKWSIILMVLGAVLFGIGVAFNLDYPARIWTAILYNDFYFTAMALAAMFFVAAHTVGLGGWFINIKRISEAMSTFLWIGAPLLLVVFFFGMHDIYHWSHEGLNDPIIEAKRAWLNRPLFLILSVVYLALWMLLPYLVRKNSLAMDKADGQGWLKLYNKSRIVSVFFLVVFAISTSTAIWHWLMSIDPHWYSTLYGWYCFISFFVASCAVTVILMYILKSQGYLKNVTTEHFHDVGKFMFAFSVAWGYLWFSQFMLIWYSNIPEETLYFRDRWDNYSTLFLLNFFMNFVLPFLILMTANAKRNPKVLVFAGIVIVIGHWLDFYLMTMPGAIKNAHYATEGGEQIFSFGIGFLEIGLLLLFAGLFSYCVFRALTKSSLVPKGHPFFKESLTHHI